MTCYKYRMPQSAHVKLGRRAVHDIDILVPTRCKDREGNVGTERKTAGKWGCQLKTLHLREKDEVKVFANKAGSTLGQAGGCSNPGNR